MEYNKTKRGLELGAVLTALIYCAIDLVIEIVSLVKIFSQLNWLKENYPKYYAETIGALMGEMIGFFIGVALVVVEVIFAIILIKKPKYTENGFKSKKNLKITFIVISSILTLILFIGVAMGSMSWFGIVGILSMATVIVLVSFTMSMKDVKDFSSINQENGVSANFAIGQKIAELKHLKELGVIDEEQYKNAVEKNIKEII